MVNEEIYQSLLKIVPEDEILQNEPMKNHTSFRVGGNADFLVSPTEVDEVKQIVELCRHNVIPLTLIGNGTNTLVRDGGVRGITLKPCLKRMTKENIDDYFLYTCGSGLSIATIANRATEDELTGLEFAAGIPGSLGGAIRMNAGAYGGQMEDVVVETTYMDYDGDIYTINSEDHEFEYRNSIFSKVQAIILESKLKLKKGNKQEIIEQIRANKEDRDLKQPLDYPSAGSTFKRGNGFITAKLIDECGLKGYKIGGAKVSEKHAGFIINCDNATAKDILNLIDYIKTNVKEKTGYTIEEEIQVIGEENDT